MHKIYPCYVEWLGLNRTLKLKLFLTKIKILNLKYLKRHLGLANIFIKRL